MSRREDRQADPKPRRSRFDREPSPKRSRRDEKPVAEKQLVEKNEGPKEHVDPLPLETLPSTNPVTDTKPAGKDSPMKGHGNSEGTKPSSGPTDGPRPRSYYQHDERGISGSGSRSSGRRSTSDRGLWKDSRDGDVKASDRTRTRDARRDDDSRKGDDSTGLWRHDGFFEMEANPNPPPPPPAEGARKRPAFREQKVTAEGQAFEKSKADAAEPDDSGRFNERKEARRHYSNHRERPERTYGRDSTRPHRREDSRGGFASRERFGDGNSNRGKDTYRGRQGYSRTGNNVPVEKWKHDLYDQANRSPSPKNEDDRIAKIEALLAS